MRASLSLLLLLALFAIASTRAFVVDNDLEDSADVDDDVEEDTAINFGSVASSSSFSSFAQAADLSQSIPTADDMEDDDGDDTAEGPHSGVSFGTPNNITANVKADLVFPDGFEVDVSSTSANSLTVTSGAPATTTPPPGYTALATKSYTLAFARQPTSGIKLEYHITAAMHNPPSDARLAHLKNGAWVVDESGYKFDNDESKVQYSGAAATSATEWMVVVKAAGSGAGTDAAATTAAETVKPNTVTPAVQTVATGASTGTKPSSATALDVTVFTVMFGCGLALFGAML
ncbi:hypothetical protein HDU97_009533 [Phlyctochytrium planicorne]|nr:hypothetical protein HDU97_009533 [Phlyctochytrium planicorne]